MITEEKETVEGLQDFPLIRLRDKVFDPKWLSFKLDLDYIEANSLSQFN